MKTKKTKWVYHTSHSFKLNGKKMTMASQLYQIGVYVIINNDPSMQMNMLPNDIAKHEKKLKADEGSGIITNLEFGLPITVTLNADGFYEKVEE